MARVAREMQAQAAQRALLSPPKASNWTEAPAPAPGTLSPRVGDALLTLGGAGGPIDPMIRQLAQAVVAYGQD